VEPVGKAWVLDTDTKGTGAQMRPLEDVLEKPERRERKPARRPAGAEAPPRRQAPRKPPAEKRVSTTPLAPGQVRKKSTGEIGKILSVDPKAGTAVVRWLRDGRASTVPLTAVSRR
jgi:hypothetical protein